MSDRKKKMILQRIFGVVLIALGVATIIIAMHGKTPEDRDATAVLIFAPLGIWLLVSKDCILS